jgi:hypothetical protein
MISTATFPNFGFDPSIVLYSTIRIVDSNLQTGPPVNIGPPMDTSVSSIQSFDALCRWPPKPQLWIANPGN